MQFHELKETEFGVGSGLGIETNTKRNVSFLQKYIIAQLYVVLNNSTCVSLHLNNRRSTCLLACHSRSRMKSRL